MPENIDLLYTKLSAKQGINLPDIQTFKQRYDNPDGMALLHSKMSNMANVNIPDLETFKGRYMSPQGTQATQSAEPDYDFIKSLYDKKPISEAVSTILGDTPDVPEKPVKTGEPTGDPFIDAGMYVYNKFFNKEFDKEAAKSAGDKFDAYQQPSKPEALPTFSSPEQERDYHLTKIKDVTAKTDSALNNIIRASGAEPSPTSQKIFAAGLGLNTEFTQNSDGELIKVYKPLPGAPNVQQIEDQKKQVADFYANKIDEVDKKYDKSVHDLYSTFGVSLVPNFVKELLPDPNIAKLNGDKKKEIGDIITERDKTLSLLNTKLLDTTPISKYDEDGVDISKISSITNNDNLSAQDKIAKLSQSIDHFKAVNKDLKLDIDPQTQNSEFMSAAQQRGIDLMYADNPNVQAVKKDVYGHYIKDGLGYSDAITRQQALYVGAVDLFNRASSEVEAGIESLKSNNREMAQYQNIITGGKPVKLGPNLVTPEKAREKLQELAALNTSITEAIKSQRDYKDNLQSIIDDKTLSYQSQLKQQERVNKLSAYAPITTRLTESISDISANLAKAEVSRIQDWTAADNKAAALHEILTNDFDKAFIKTQVMDKFDNTLKTYAEEEAIQLYDDKGNWNPYVNPQAIWYNTVKTGIESEILGGFMSAGKYLADPLFKGLDAAITRGADNLMTKVAGPYDFETASLGRSAFKVGGGILQDGIIKAGNFATQGYVATMLPTYMMYGDQMIDQELAKGLSYHDAHEVGKYRAYVEGFTELAFKNEMNFFNQTIGSGGIRNFAHLAEDDVYRRLILDASTRKFGTEMGLKVANAYFTGGKVAKEVIKVLAEEAGEEIEGNVLNAKVVDPIAKKAQPGYLSSEDLTFQNAINTAITTAATMLPMGGTMGLNIHKENLSAREQARFTIGQNPETYLTTLLSAYNAGAISKPDFERQAAAVNTYKTAHDTALGIASQNPNWHMYNQQERDLLSFRLFNNLATQERLSKNLAEAQTDEQKATLVKSLDFLSSNFLELTSKGVYKSEEDRVSHKTKELNYYVNPESLKVYNDVTTLANIGKQLVSEVTNEPSQKLKDLYNQKSELVANRIKEVRAAEEEAAKPETDKADANNEARTIGIVRDGKEETLDMNTPYYASRIEDVSTTGKKIITRPEITILHDNGDGTVLVSSNGETATLPKDDLSKFKFTKKSTIETMRKAGDPKAFAFDHENDVFSYDFNSATEDRPKTVEGRIKYNPTSNAIELVYKNSKGKTLSYKLSKSDLAKLSDNSSRLKFKRTLETDAEYGAKQAILQKEASATNFDNLQSQSARRAEFIKQYIDSKVESLKANREQVRLTENSLLDVEIEIEKLTKELHNKNEKTAKGTRRVDFTKLLTKVRDLTAQHEALQKVLDDLDTQKNDIQNEIDYLNKYKDQDFASDKSLVDQFLDDWIDLNEQKSKIDEVIASIEKLMTGIQQSIRKVADIVNKLVAGFERTYPGRELSFDPSRILDLVTANNQTTKEFPNTRDFFYRYPEYLKNLNNFNQLVNDNLDKIDLSERRLEDLSKSLEANVKLAKSTADLIRYQEGLIKEAQTNESKFKADLRNKKVQAIGQVLFNNPKLLSSSGTGNPNEDIKKVGSPKLSLSQFFQTTTSGATFNSNGLDNPQVHRLQNFLNNVSDFSDKYLLVITKDNAKKYGLENIIWTGGDITNVGDEENKNDIKLVFIKVSSEGNPIFLDQNGQPIETSDGKVSPDEIVYSSMRQANLNWKNGEEAVVDKENLGEGAGELIRKTHASFRNDLIKAAKNLKNSPRLAISGVSRGFSTQKTDVPFTAAQAFGNKVPDLANVEVVKIPIPDKSRSNIGQVLYPGGKALINMPIGRPVYAHDQDFEFLDNRKLNRVDAEKFQRIFRNIYEGIGSAQDITDMLDYVRKVLYYRDPSKVSKITNTAQETEVGNNQIWFSQENGQLILNLGTAKVPFNFEKGNIDSLLAVEAFFTANDVYHNVDNQDMIGKEFKEYYLDGKELKTRVWPAYQQYLLANTYPDGTARPIEDTPLTVRLQPSTDLAPNKVGRYATYNNTKVQDVVTKTVAATAEAKPATISATPKSEARVEDGYLVKEISVADIGSPNSEFVGRMYNLQQFDNATDKEPKYEIAFKKSNGRFVILGVENIDMEQAEKVLAKTIESNKEIQKSTVKVIQGDPIKTEAEKKVEPVLTIAEDDVPFDTYEKEVEAAPTTGKKKVTRPSGDRGNYRVATREDYVRENLTEARKWWNERFSLPFHIAYRLVDGFAWGKISNGAVTLSNVAEQGTIYHEAFEAFWNYFATPREQKQLLREFRDRAGSFTEYDTGKTIKYRDATAAQAKEQMAEEYRNLELTGSQPIVEPAKKGFIRKFLESIYDFIHSKLFGDPLTIQEAFNRISNAKYRDAVPRSVESIDTQYRNALQETNPVLFNTIMKSMTNLLFQNLQNLNVSIPEFLQSKNYSVREQYVRVKADLDKFYGGDTLTSLIAPYVDKDDFASKLDKNDDLYNQFAEALEPTGLNASVFDKYEHILNITDGIYPQEILKNLYTILKNYEYINDNWNNLKAEHGKFLESNYKISAPEDSEVEDLDEKNQNEYGPDPLTINAKQNASTEIKLLIATLIKSEYKDALSGVEGLDREEVPVLNDMLLSELVDYGKTMISLLYKFAPATSFDEMADILRKEAAIDASYNGIIRKLKLDSPISELSNYDRDLRDKFYMSMNKMQIDHQLNILDPEDLSGAIIELNNTNAIRVIKDKWSNNLKADHNLTKTDAEGNKSFNKAAFGSPSITNYESVVRFLKSIKIDFDKVPARRMSKKETADVIEAARDLHKVLSSGSPNKIFLQNDASTRGPLNTLATIYAKYSGFYSEPQYLNVEGKPVQAIILHNFIGLTSKIFNSSSNYDELVRNIPQYTQSDENPYLSFSQVLGVGNRFFDDDGNRTRDLNIKILGGSRVRGSETGITTSSLSAPDYIAQEFSNNLEGDYSILITADSKTEWGINFGTFVTKLQSANISFVSDILKKYLASEILTAQKSKDSNLVNVRKTGLRLRQFEGILRSIDSKYTLPLSYDKSPEDIIAENETDIDQAIERYIQQRVQKTFDYFMENNIINRKKAVADADGLIIEGDEELYTVLGVAREHIGDGLSLDQIKQLIQFREINYTMAMLEQFKLFWGDPAQWKDIFKRTKPYVSGRNLSIHNAQYFNDWHNQHSNVKSYVDENGELQTITLQPGDIGHINYNDEIRTQTYSDVLTKSDIAEQLFKVLLDKSAEQLFGKQYADLTDDERTIANVPFVEDGRLKNPYEKNNEADAQAWAFPLGYEEMRRRNADWSDADQEQMDWDMANFRNDTNRYPDGERGDKLRAYDKALIAQGNPYTNRFKANAKLPVSNVLKPIYSGWKEGTVAAQDIRKMSIAPLSWSLVKGTAMEPIFIAHITAAEPTHFMNMESAQKVGAEIGMQPIYSDGKANTNVKQEKLNFKYFGIQVETKTQKDKVSQGTQLNKLAVLNLVINGVPIDFIKDNKGLSKEAIRNKWNSLSNTAKVQQSRYHNLIQKNTKYLTAMRVMAKNEIFDEFGVVQDGNKLRFSNFEKLAELIANELSSRDATENLKQAMTLVTKADGTQGFELPMDLAIGSDRLEAIFTSIIDSRILRPKMYGGQMPQVASTLLESKAKSRELVHKDAKGVWQTVTDLNDLSPEQRGGVRITSNELKWYSKEEPWIEVMVPFYMQELISKGQTLSIKELQDAGLEWGVGFRIPTQELNSVEHIRIKGFLPVEYGNSIVVPTEITTKAGSDFDIDKLNLYLYNYSINPRTGRPEKIKYLDNGNSIVEERYEALRKPLYTFLDSPQGYEYYKKQVAQAAITKLIEDNSEDAIDPYEGKIDPRKTYEENLKIADEEYEKGLEEFKKLPIELQNTREAIDNAYIDNLRDILSVPDNFAQLILPNSAKVLSDQAEEMNTLWGNHRSKTDYSAFLDSMKNAQTRIAFLVGKGGVAIGAVAQTLHAISQISAMEFTENEEDTIPFHFPTNSTKDGNLRTYNLGEQLTTDGQSISSIISAFINAFVDIAKDPFILDINGDKSTAGLYIAAFKLGMPVPEVVRWFNQPIIREYTKMLQQAKSTSAEVTGADMTKAQILTILGDKFKFDTNGYQISTTPRSGNYTVQELEGYIKEWRDQEETKLITNLDGDVIDDKTPGLSQKFYDNQANLLAEFRKLDGITWSISGVQNALADTKRTVNFDSIRLAMANVVKALDGPFRDSLITILEDTFIGSILTARAQVLQAIQPLFLTESIEARRILGPMMTSIFTAFGRADVKEELAKNMRKEFINYLLQTIPVQIEPGSNAKVLTSAIKDLFIGTKDSEPAIKSLGKLQGQLDSRQESNFLLDNMLGVDPTTMGKTGNVKTIQMIRRMSDKIDSDLATADWNNLFKNPETAKFAYDLIKVALLQTGLRVGPTSFSQLIPNEVFASIAHQIEDYFNSSDISDILSNFEASYYQNNWWNRDLIPKAPLKTEEIDHEILGPIKRVKTFRHVDGIGRVLAYWAESGGANKSEFKPGKALKNKYLFHSEMIMNDEGKPLYSNREREDMAKRGDFSFLKTTLYKRYEVTNPDTGFTDVPLVKFQDKSYTNHYVIYYPVPKYGRRNEVTEHYSEMKKSAVNPMYQDEVIHSRSGGSRPFGIDDITKAIVGADKVSGRFLSQITGTDEDNEKYQLAISNPLYKHLAEDMEDLSKVVHQLLESRTPKKELKTEEDPFKC